MVGNANGINIISLRFKVLNRGINMKQSLIDRFIQIFFCIKNIKIFINLHLSFWETKVVTENTSLLNSPFNTFQINLEQLILLNFSYVNL